MTIDVLFIHSAGSQSGEEGSSPFVKQLRNALGTNYNVIFPLMPNPDAPSYASWKAALDTILSDTTLGDTIRGKTAPGNKSPDKKIPPILVGHSLGGSVLLKYISEQKPEITARGLFIVAAPYWGSDDWTVKEFILRENFASFLPDTLKVYLYQSNNDEVVPADHLARYATAIPSADVRKLDTGGHTFKQGLPELVEDINALATALI